MLSTSSKKNILIITSLFLLCLSSFSHAQNTYTPARHVGLSPIKPYPGKYDICQLLRVNKHVKKYVKSGKKLIACPRHERGAVGDWTAKGWLVVGHRKGWSILRSR